MGNSCAGGMGERGMFGASRVFLMMNMMSSHSGRETAGIRAGAAAPRPIFCCGELMDSSRVVRARRGGMFSTSPSFPSTDVVHEACCVGLTEGDTLGP